VPRPLGPAVSRGAANVAALRRLRNMVRCFAGSELCHKNVLSGCNLLAVNGLS